jgi:hypothetical protein
MTKFFQTVSPFLVAFAFVFSGCKKEIETQIQIKEVEKKASWTEVSGLSGFERIILSTGSNGQSIYLQQPNFFTRLSTQNRSQGITVSGGRLPTDLGVRLPIGRDFFAYPDTDSSLVLCRNNEPLNYQFYIGLRRFDKNAIRLNTRLFSLSKCMAINQNNYLLAPYENNRPDRAFTFILAAVTPGAGGFPVSATTRKVVIPQALSSGSYVRNLAAIDDYFLVNLGDAGIYKIKQDGSYRQVYTYAIVDAFYKWQGIVYAPAEYNEMLTSADNGDTWQKSTGTPDHFTLANYYPVRDSLVGVFFGNLYTLRWNGPRFTSRFLKNDGLERATITGVEYLRDTVYVATTSGLFARPVKSFFETKP